MIKEEFIEITWSNSMSKYYLSLGYEKLNQGDKFKISAKHIPKQSNVEVTSVCDLCSNEIVCQFKRHKDICISCKQNTLKDKYPKINFNLIVEKKINVKLSRTSKVYYKNIGYNVDGVDNICVDVIHLPRGSQYLLNVICSRCSKIRNISLRSYREICSECALIDMRAKITPEDKINYAKLNWERNRELLIEKIKLTRKRGSENPQFKQYKDETRRYWQDKEWAKMIKAKFSYTCNVCGDNRGGNLVSHHLMSYKYFPELRTDESNGVCLCTKCHNEFHNKYGKVKCTTEQYLKFKFYKQLFKCVNSVVKSHA